MEGEHFQIAVRLVACALRENTDGNTGFDLFHGGEDDLQPLLHVAAVQEQTVKILHPVGEQRIALHLLFGNIAGADRTTAVGEKNIKIAPMVSDIENRRVLGHVFFSDDRNLYPGDFENKAKSCLDDPKRADILFQGSKFSNDPFCNQQRGGQDQETNNCDTNKCKSNHDNGNPF